MAERLIDAEAFQRFIEQRDESADYTIYHFEEWLEQQPTTEAKPVVHAYWEKVNPVKGVEASAMCSNCKVYAGYWDATMEEFDFCPFCGAQMDSLEGKNE